MRSFVDLSREEKLHCLLRFAHELTIVARDSYDANGDGVAEPRRLRTLNEMQHRLLANCVALLEDDPKRYPDEVLLEMLLDHPQDVMLETAVRQAFDRTLSRLAPAA